MANEPEFKIKSNVEIFDLTNGEGTGLILKSKKNLPEEESLKIEKQYGIKNPFRTEDY